MVFKLDAPVQLSKSTFGYKIVPSKEDEGPYAGANSLDEILARQAVEIKTLTTSESGSPASTTAATAAKSRKSKRGFRRAGL